MSLPEFLYLTMGVVIARIFLEKVNTKGYSTLQWMQFLFEILRIVVLWPLVLFLEKFEKWLKTEENT